MNNPTLQNIAILGATGSVGSALARQLVAKGHKVFLAGRNEEVLKSLASELSSEFAIVEATQTGSVEECLSKAKESLCEINGIANCIGSVLLKAAHTTSQDEWDETIAVNLTSAFNVVKAAGKLMRSNGGSVVLVSSSAAEIGLPNHEAIAAAKAGIIGLTRSAAASYANRGIRFNAITPGLVKSNMTKKLWENPAAAQMSIDMHALGRLGEPEDIANAIAFLLDGNNSWISGQVLGVDGGLGSLLPRQKAK